MPPPPPVLHVIHRPSRPRAPGRSQPLEHDHDRPTGHASTVGVKAIAFPSRNNSIRSHQNVVDSEAVTTQMSIERVPFVLIAEVQIDPHAVVRRISAFIVYG
jgi:hypothetical protein